MRTLVWVGGITYNIPTVKFTDLVTSALQSKVTLFTVRPDSAEKQVGEADLAQATELLSRAPFSSWARRGAPDEEILAEVNTGSYDLVVVDARDYLSLRELILGFFARRVVTHMEISVLVVRQPKFRLKQIFISTAG